MAKSGIYAFGVTYQTKVVYVYQDKIGHVEKGKISILIRLSIFRVAEYMKVLLDNYQVNAIKIKEKNVLVVAAPGSGKTTVIINRVNYLIEERKARTRDIIVITFTKAAAENMKNRYKNTFNKTVSPFFGTFHGLFYKILLREGYKINIIESGKCHSIIRVILSKYFDDVNDDKIREVLNNISLFKTSLGNIENFKPTISNEIFKECYEQYEEYKAKEQLWDFDDCATRS
ncbi:UvrD-helicase domain-containing protein [Clostridium sp. ETTB3]